MLRLLTSSEAHRLRGFFRETGYGDAGFGEVFGVSELPLPTRSNLPSLLDCTREPTTLNLLLRWFFLGVPVAASIAECSLPDWLLPLCARCGLLRAEEGELLSDVSILPLDDLLVTADALRRLSSQERFDHVLTVNPTARHLLNFTIRRPCPDTLDLCGGCGVQALAAARHSERIVATDLNPRAMEFAQFNAALNGLDNIQCLAGDGFAPVAGRTFDLIVCNPPFILSPTTEFLCRENRLPYDAFCRQLIKAAPAFLKPGGYYQMICEWVQIEGESWQDRLSEWFEGTGCDAWVLKANTELPANYARNRIEETQLEGGTGDETNFDKWMDYYRHGRVVGIHGGMMAMRRRDGDNWIRFGDLSAGVSGPFGDAVVEVFASEDLLHACRDDGALLQARLRLAERVRLEESCRLADGIWQTESIRLQRTGPLPETFGLDGILADVLARFDGNRTIDAILHDVAAERGVEPARMQPGLLDFFRTLMKSGFLR
jgi:hypothetical protein